MRALIIAALGCLLALQSTHKAEAHNAQANQPETGQSAPPRAARDLPSAAPYKADCKRPNSLEESDLCAQWSAVKAVRDANAIGAETLYWTRIGIVAVLVTLAFTALATWAAARAAKAASRSMTLFQNTESGMLIAAINLISQHVVHVGAVNRGRTMVSVLHADLACTARMPTGPVPVVVAGGDFETDVGIAEGKSYDFKARGIELPEAVVYLVGGILYRTIFGTFEVCKIAIKLDRRTGRMEIVHTADFSRWERWADRLTKGKKMRKI